MKCVANRKLWKRTST